MATRTACQRHPGMCAGDPNCSDRLCPGHPAQQWDALAERAEPVPTAEEAMAQADDAIGVTLGALVMVITFIVAVHIWWS